MKKLTTKKNTELVKMPCSACKRIGHNISTCSACKTCLSFEHKTDDCTICSNCKSTDHKKDTCPFCEWCKKVFEVNAIVEHREKCNKRLYQTIRPQIVGMLHESSGRYGSYINSY